MRKNYLSINVSPLLMMSALIFTVLSVAYYPYQIPVLESSGNPDSSGIALGVYEPSQGTSGNAIDGYTNEVGRKPAFAWLPVRWENSNGDYIQFDSAYFDQFRTRGIMPGVTWEPSKGPAWQTGPNQPDFSWTAIASGKHDAYIMQWARDAATYHYPFILRTLWEMDGNWYPWGYNVNGNTNTADYIAAWKHIVNIFRNEGATNVQFAWVPSVLDTNLIRNYGDTLKAMYPGDGYVDWVGFDGYTSDPKNKSFQDVFLPTYNFVAGFSSRPMMIFESGCTEDSTDSMAKANWITKGFLTTIPSLLPRIKIADWFNANNDKGTKDYSFETSQNSLDAWKQVVASPLYQGSLLTGIRKENNVIPVHYELFQNYPNPFNPATSISYQLSKYSHVTLKVYDLLGKEIVALVNENQQAGSYSIQFSASRYHLASGVYFCRMQADGFVETRKLLLLK